MAASLAFTLHACIGSIRLFAIHILIDGSNALVATGEFSCSLNYDWIKYILKWQFHFPLTKNHLTHTEHFHQYFYINISLCWERLDTQPHSNSLMHLIHAYNKFSTVLRQHQSFIHRNLCVDSTPIDEWCGFDYRADCMKINMINNTTKYILLSIRFNPIVWCACIQATTSVWCLSLPFDT